MSPAFGLLCRELACLPVDVGGTVSCQGSWAVWESWLLGAVKGSEQHPSVVSASVPDRAAAVSSLSGVLRPESVS